MANEQNLKPFTSQQSRAEAVKNGRKGGKASAAKRAERKSIREGLLLLLNEPIKDRDGKDSGKTTQDAMIAGVMKRAIAGDVRAAEFIRDTIGEKPIERVANITPDPEIISGVEKALFGDDAK